MKRLLALLVLLAAGAVHAQGNLPVATCSSATPGQAWGSQWLPCATTVAYLVPNQNTIIALQTQASGFANFWNYASTAVAADHVWNGTQWVPASAIAPLPSGPVVTVSWGAVTQNVDGSPVTAPITYNLYQGQNGTPNTKVQTGITALTTKVTTGIPNNTVQCWAVSATDGNGTEGAQSPQTSGSCLSFKTAPGTPQNTKATITGTAAAVVSPTAKKKK